MFPVGLGVCGVGGCFPRVRGDVPSKSSTVQTMRWFSPRARGCSAEEELKKDKPAVFPACAGMFLVHHSGAKFGLGFPRVRGDVPDQAIYPTTNRRFSPRARGCSQMQLQKSFSNGVFPACAGMFLRRSNPHATLTGFPRARGDVPKRRAARVREYSFSPRTRGCSV